MSSLAFCILFPELALRIFAAMFERSHHFFGKRRIFGNRFAHENARETEATSIGGIGTTVNARFKNSLRREFATDRCGNQRVCTEGGQVARIDARHHRLGSGITQCFGHQFQLAQVIGFANFHKCLHIKTLGTLSHLYQLGIV